MNPRPVDMELKKAFTELQQKMIDTRQKLRLSDIQIESQKRTIQHAKLTEKEIELLPKGTRTFQGVGRMFLLRDQTAVVANLKRNIEMANTKIKNLENNKEYLERSFKESENNLRELIQQKQGSG